MSNLSIQLPDSLCKILQKLAEQDGISLDQFIALAVGERISGICEDKYRIYEDKCWICLHNAVIRAGKY